jgi:TRAP-type C4-dicarboxylate transport system permease small subunit
MTTGSGLATPHDVVPAARSLSMKIERVLDLMVEIPAGILVVAEIVILFSGIVARYVFKRPLIWSSICA